MVITRDPPEVDWGDDDWVDDKRTAALLRIVLRGELEIERLKALVAKVTAQAAAAYRKLGTDEPEGGE